MPYLLIAILLAKTWSGLRQMLCPWQLFSYSCVGTVQWTWHTVRFMLGLCERQCVCTEYIGLIIYLECVCVCVCFVGGGGWWRHWQLYNSTAVLPELLWWVCLPNLPFADYTGAQCSFLSPHTWYELTQFVFTSTEKPGKLIITSKC